MREAGERSKIVTKRLFSEPTVWALLVLLIVVCAFGGGSRHDIANLVWLRTATVLILAFVLWGMTRHDLSTVKGPFLLILGLGCVMLLQLIPLPASLWSALPGRELIHELDQLAGLGEIWRPITLSRSATWNALASLIVPFTALAIFAKLSDEARGTLPLFIVGISSLSAILGILQVTLGAPEALYFYDVTNRGSAVGLFANRNHSGALVAIGLLIVLWHLSDRNGQRSNIASLAWVALALALLGGVMVNGSRAGLLSAALAVILVLGVRGFEALKLEDRPAAFCRGLFPLLLGSISVFGTGLMFVLMDRSEAAARLFGAEPSEGLRWQVAATTLRMAWDNLVFGVGYGAFETAYRMVEPRELLSPRYFNEAHNDWLQFVIEGGLAGLGILIAAAFMMARRSLISIGSETEAHTREKRRLAWMVLVILSFASLADYPMRTPVMMVVGAWVLFTLGRGPRAPFQF